MSVSKLKQPIITIFEPHIQAMITERIVLFHEGLVKDGVIHWTGPHSLLDDNTQQDQSSRPLALAHLHPLEHGRKRD